MMKIPGPTVEKIVPGVFPVFGEIGRYRVRSRSGESDYFVDIFENALYGKCDCLAFVKKYEPSLKRGIPIDGSLKCFHVKQAEAYFKEDMKRRIWLELHKGQEQPKELTPYKPKEVKHESHFQPRPEAVTPPGIGTKKTYYLKR